MERLSTTSKNGLKTRRPPQMTCRASKPSFPSQKVIGRAHNMNIFLKAFMGRCSLAVLLASIAICGGCGETNSQSFVLHPKPSPGERAYIVNSAPPGSTGDVFGYDLPLSAASQPSVDLKFPVGVFFQNAAPTDDCGDRHGNLYVTLPAQQFLTGGPINAYVPPITSSSTPAFTLNGAFEHCASDPNGDLFATTQVFTSVVTGGLVVFPAPVSAASTSKAIFQTSFYNVGEVTADAVGDAFVTTSTGIQEWTMSGTLLATFGTVGLGSLTIGPDGNLYVPNGGIDVYKPSAFHNGGAKDHTISLGGFAAFVVAFDDSGNMFVLGRASTGPPELRVIPPPYTTVNFLLPVMGQNGLAITP